MITPVYLIKFGKNMGKGKGDGGKGKGAKPKGGEASGGAGKECNNKSSFVDFR